VHPVFRLNIFDLGIAIPSYRLFIILAAVTVMVVTFALASRRGLPPGRSLTWILVTAVSVPVGARLLYLLTSPQGLEQLDSAWSLQPVGFALYGGLILAVLTGWVVSRVLQLPLWPLADISACALGLGIVVVRMGCLLNGCCFGNVTDLAWGITFPAGSPAHIYQINHGIADTGLFGLPWSPHAVHPTQLLEMGAGLIGSLLVVYFMKRKDTQAGIGFLSFALWFSAFRWVNSYLRAPAPSFNAPAYFYPLLYSLIILLSISTLVGLYMGRTDESSISVERWERRGVSG